jgi:hypothetical protein
MAPVAKHYYAMMEKVKQEYNSGKYVVRDEPVLPPDAFVPASIEEVSLPDLSPQAPDGAELEPEITEPQTDALDAMIADLADHPGVSDISDLEEVVGDEADIDIPEAASEPPSDDVEPETPPDETPDFDEPDIEDDDILDDLEQDVADVADVEQPVIDMQPEELLDLSDDEEEEDL